MYCQVLLPLVCVLVVLTCAAAQRPLVVAHRGASGKLPEHTREAYLEAIKEGAGELFAGGLEVVVST